MSSDLVVIMCYCLRFIQQNPESEFVVNEWIHDRLTFNLTLWLKGNEILQERYSAEKAPVSSLTNPNRLEALT